MVGAKAFMRRQFRRFGLDVVSRARMVPVDCRHLEDPDPRAVSYQAAGRSALVRVPLWRCLGLHYFAFAATTESASPLVRTIRALREKGLAGYDDSPLALWYRQCQPASAAELMGLSAGTDPLWRDTPAAGAILFWRDGNPLHQVEQRLQQLREDNRLHGLNKAAPGDPFYGPVAPEKGQLEFERLQRIMASIETSGFHVDPQGEDNIRVVALHNGKDWRWCVVNSGQHRLAALAALGHQDAPVQVMPEGSGGVVRLSEAAHWPLVRRGLLSVAEAEQLFVRVFAGQPPEVARWE